MNELRVVLLAAAILFGLGWYFHEPAPDPKSWQPIVNKQWPPK